MIAIAQAILCRMRFLIALGALVAFAPSYSAIGAAQEVPQSDRLEQSEPEPPSEADRAEMLAELYDRLGQAQDAESAAAIARTIEEKWLTSGSDTVDVLMSRALTLVQDNNYDQAIEILDSVTSIAPDYSEGWNQRATLFFLKEDYDRSLKDLRQVLALDPHHFKAINGLALILQQLGDKPAALKAYRKALQVHPHLGGASQAIRELERDVEGQGI
jgi:tetratricopeptide (TPR) repeat protein